MKSLINTKVLKKIHYKCHTSTLMNMVSFSFQLITWSLPVRLQVIWNRAVLYWLGVCELSNTSLSCSEWSPSSDPLSLGRDFAPENVSLWSHHLLVSPGGGSTATPEHNEIRADRNFTRWWCHLSQGVWELWHTLTWDLEISAVAESSTWPL